MNKLFLGNISIIFGGLILSVEIYGLKIIKALDIISQKYFWDNPLIYVNEFPINIAMSIPVIIILYGIALIISHLLHKKK